MNKSTFIAPDGSFDITRAWKETKKALRAMTPEEKKQTLVDAGILTKSGRVARFYKGVFMPAKKASRPARSVTRE